ncbi:hypothetical protein KPA93_03175, partial [Burkholderia cenocepacia]
LLPFYPSPRRDDCYDIADYRDVHPDYGTLADVRRFIREAHARGIRVIAELVITHTSDQHPWFQRARRAKPGSTHRDYYVWSDTDTKYAGTLIIFLDTGDQSRLAHDALRQFKPPPACAETLELRHFNFAQMRHYNFALTPFKLIIRIMSIYVPVVIVRSDCGHPKSRTLQ